MVAGTCAIIQNISPFFAKIEGETHHQKCYEKYPNFLAVGWMDTFEVQDEAVFRYLVQRNVLNWHATFIVDSSKFTQVFGNQASALPAAIQATVAWWRQNDKGTL